MKVSVLVSIVLCEIAGRILPRGKCSTMDTLDGNRARSTFGYFPSFKTALQEQRTHISSQVEVQRYVSRCVCDEVKFHDMFSRYVFVPVRTKTGRGHQK